MTAARVSAAVCCLLLPLLLPVVPCSRLPIVAGRSVVGPAPHGEECELARLRGGWGARRGGGRKRLDWQSPKTDKRRDDDSSSEWFPEIVDLPPVASWRSKNPKGRHSLSAASPQEDSMPSDSSEQDSGQLAPPKRPAAPKVRTRISVNVAPHAAGGRGRPKRQAVKDAEKARWGTRAHERLERALLGLPIESDDDSEFQSQSEPLVQKHKPIGRAAPAQKLKNTAPSGYRGTHGHAVERAGHMASRKQRAADVKDSTDDQRGLGFGMLGRCAGTPFAGYVQEEAFETGGAWQQAINDFERMGHGNHFDSAVGVHGTFARDFTQAFVGKEEATSPVALPHGQPNPLQEQALSSGTHMVDLKKLCRDPSPSPSTSLYVHPAHIVLPSREGSALPRAGVSDSATSAQQSPSPHPNDTFPPQELLQVDERFGDAAKSADMGIDSFMIDLEGEDGADAGRSDLATIEGRLQEALRRAYDSQGALVLRHQLLAISGAGHGSEHCGVQTADIDSAIGDALRLAYEAVEEVRALPNIESIQYAHGLDKIQLGVEWLQERADILKGLLCSDHRRAQLLATPAFPQKSHFAPGKGSQDEELRRDALSAKRSLLLDGVWDAVTRAVGSVPAASKLPTRCVYIGGYKGLCDKRMKEILERDCGRMEAFEWHEGWSFARWAREEAAEKALMARWKAGARGPALVVLPAPDGKIVRGGLLLEMSRGQGTCSRIARKV